MGGVQRAGDKEHPSRVKYRSTEKLPGKEGFGLICQRRRNAASIPSKLQRAPEEI
jgi:hypothetical protein